MSVAEIAARKREYLSDEERSRNFQNLKMWLDTQRHLPAISDDQLLTFLNSCNNSVEASKSCIELYYTMRMTSPEFFANRDPLNPEIRDVTKVVRITTLNSVSAEGYRYVFTRLHNPDPAVYHPANCIKLLFMVIDAALRENALAPGIVIISDIRGLTLAHALKNDLSCQKKYTQYLQEAMPVKMKAMHMLYATSLMTTIMAIVKPFLRKEVTQMIHFHKSGDGMQEFYRSVPQRVLPRDYGGEDLSTDELFDNTLKQMEECRDWFKQEEEQCKVDESKREGRKGGHKQDLQRPFKSLDID